MTQQAFSARTLREPLVAYYTDTYNTLVSIVQGVALGVLVTENKQLLDPAQRTLAACLNAVSVVVVVAIVWHRYVSHNQFLTWRPKVVDAVLPMALAIVQMALAVSIASTPGRFSSWLVCVALGAAAAYANTLWRIAGLEVPESLLDVSPQSDATPLLDAVSRFQREALKDVVAAAVLFTIPWILASRGFVGQNGEAIFCLAAVSLVGVGLFVRDLPSHLERHRW